MGINVEMPQMGESILEGTITRWLKKPGDPVKRDESLFEVSTDKVDSEVPSPADGVVGEIIVQEGETVKIGTVVAVIAEAPAGAVEKPPPGAEPEERVSVPVAAAGAPEAAAAGVPEAVAAGTPEAKIAEEPAMEAPVERTPPKMEPEPPAVEQTAPVAEETAPAAGILPEAEPAGTAAPETAGEPETVPAAETVAVAAPEEEKEPPVHEKAPALAAEPESEAAAEPTAYIRSSPLARRIAREHGIDLSEIRGTGLSGRITKDDVLAFVSRSGRREPPRGPEAAVSEVETSVPGEIASMPVEEIPGTEAPAPLAESPQKETAPIVRERQAEIEAAAIPRSDGDTETVTMTPMRKTIAERMVLSRRTSAHVQTVFEVDMTSIVRLRERHQQEFEAREGFKLNYTVFFVKALVETAREFPILNSSVSGDRIVFRKSIHVGIAVALDTGLIVPVIQNAHLKSFTALAEAIHDLAGRARAKKLKPEEVQHGTISITNPGIYGSLFGMPIISQPQVAILDVGCLQKRPVVINDAIAIRTMVYLALSFDHRVIDGAVADQAMASLKGRLESWDHWIE